MKNKVVVIGMVAAIALIVYFAFLYPWPEPSTAVGTIGGVKKYNAGQIKDQDVVLESRKYSETQYAEMEKRVGMMENRLSPEAQLDLLAQRARYVSERLAPYSQEQKRAPFEEQKMIELLDVLQRTAPLPYDQRIIALEKSISLPMEQQRAPLPMEQQRAPLPMEQQRAPLPMEQQRAPLPMEQRAEILINNLNQQLTNFESRLDPADRFIIINNRIYNVEERINIPMDQRTGGFKLMERIDNVESRLAPPPEVK